MPTFVPRLRSPSAIGSKRSVDLAGRAAVWAQDAQARAEEQQDFDHSILIAALLLMRDGDDTLRAKHGAWGPRSLTLLRSSATPCTACAMVCNLIRLGLATAGLVLAARHGVTMAARPLLELAVKGDPSGAWFRCIPDELVADRSPLAESGGPLRVCGQHPSALQALRCEGRRGRDPQATGGGLSVTRPSVPKWSWLQDQGPEPAWRDFLMWSLASARRLILRRRSRTAATTQAQAEYYADHQANAVWLSKLMGDGGIAPEWLKGIAHHYRT